MHQRVEAPSDLVVSGPRPCGLPTAKQGAEGGRAHGLLNVTPGDFFELKITVPEFEEQIAISNLLKDADTEIQLLKYTMENLKMQKRGLM